MFILFALFFIPRSYCYFFLGFSVLRVLFSAARCLPVGFSSNESLAFCVSVHFFILSFFDLIFPPKELCFRALFAPGVWVSYIVHLLSVGHRPCRPMDARGAVIDVHALDDVIGYFYLFTSTLHRQKIQKTQTHTCTYVHTHVHTRTFYVCARSVHEQRTLL